VTLVWLALGGVWSWLAITFQAWSVMRIGPRSSLMTIVWLVGGIWLRLGWIALLLIVALRQGIGPGLSTFAGIWLARWIMIYRWWHGGDTGHN
jgi:hypothetical protein